MEQLLETFGLLFAPKYGHTVDVNTIRKPVYLSTHPPPRKMAKISFLINRYEKLSSQSTKYAVFEAQQVLLLLTDTILFFRPRGLTIFLTK